MVFLDGITGEKALSFGGIIAILCCVLAVTAAFYVLRSIGTCQKQRHRSRVRRLDTVRLDIRGVQAHIRNENVRLVV